MKPQRTPNQASHESRKAGVLGSEFLRAGAAVGTIGLAGAALGAVCPVCVVMTPALVGLGAVQKLRAAWLARTARTLEVAVDQHHQDERNQAMNITDTHHRKLVEQGALLLDVRTPAEFAEGHVTRATNIPVQELPARLQEVGSRSRPVVVYCRSGGRSAQASAMLSAAGFQVKDIGPMTAW